MAAIRSARRICEKGPKRGRRRSNGGSEKIAANKIAAQYLRSQYYRSQQKRPTLAHIENHPHSVLAQSANLFQTDASMSQDTNSGIGKTKQEEPARVPNPIPIQSSREAPTRSDHPPQENMSQEETLLAKVYGAPFTELPRDLYIPPDALEIFIEAFEGPLDLLLYLIKRQNLNILDIPIAEVTRQYMKYVEMMKELRLELAAEYLVMAAMLAEIKSRMLLPQPKMEEEEDPRAELVRRLQEYERFKIAAQKIDALPRLGRDVFEANVELPGIEIRKIHPEVDFQEILRAFRGILARAEMLSHHQVRLEPLSIRERMANILAILQTDKPTEFNVLFKLNEGRPGIVIALLAILELIKEALIELIQTDSYGRIYVRRL
uniref:Segregation and condensation protein A n=1 Tax=Candidatus Kentrum sp. LPFa TaxID=2126335 RepID=A0A450W2P9_9GAMM|nr:MAG: condensin subunit ScpA [Candidatus Kentron sp. LPFa]